MTDTTAQPQPSVSADETASAGLPCIDCHAQIVGVFYGAGDGSGRKFRCESCHWRHENAELRTRVMQLETERAKIKVAADGVSDSKTIQRVWEILMGKEQA